MTTSTRSTFALLVLGIAAATLPLQASPLSTPLGLPDRDVVRNPYGTFVGSLGGALAPQSNGIVGPNLSFYGGTPSPILFGGGGGGVSFASGSGSSALPVFLAPSSGSNSNSTGGGGSSTYQPSGLTNRLPPTDESNGSSPAFSAPPDQSLVPGAQRVSDGGSSLILLGCAVLAAFGFGRRTRRG